MEDFGQLWLLGHFYSFLQLQGLFFKHKRGIFGHRIALSTFDNDYLLGNIHWYSFAAYVNMRTSETCFLILLVECYTAISLTENAVSFSATCISHAR